MPKTKNQICNKCLGSGQIWNGEELEECNICDGESNIESFDDIFDLDELIEPPEDHDDLKDW